MRILVTGIAGFIGSNLADYLVSLGHSVCGIDCLTDYYPKELKLLNIEQLKESGVEILNSDLAKADLEQLLNDVEFIYHFAAQPGLSASSDFYTYVHNNINATYNLLEGIRHSSKFRGLIYISSSSVYGKDATSDESTEPKPTSYYGVTKLAAEQLVMSYWRDKGLPACSLRLYSVYGPRERPEKLFPKLIESILEEKEFPLYQGSESHLRSYTYVGDIIDGLVAVLNNFDQCKGEIINIGTDKAITTGEAIKIVETIIGKPVKTNIKPKRAGDQLKTHANIDKARRLLGYNPETTPFEGLTKEVEWYKQYVFNNINLW